MEKTGKLVEFRPRPGASSRGSPELRAQVRSPTALPCPVATRARSRFARVGVHLGLTLAALAWIGGWLWWQGAEERALAMLPAAERRLLYSRTLDNLKDCHARLDEEPFHEFCEQQAALARSFPECDARCRTLSRLPWSGPRR